MTNRSTITYPDNYDERFGEFETSIRLHNNLKGREKILRTLQKTPYRFDFFIIPDLRASQKNINGDDITNLLGDHVVDPDAITSIILNNFSNDGRPLNAWMLVHRLSHAIQVFDHNNYSKCVRRDMQIMGPIIELYNRNNDANDAVECDIVDVFVRIKNARLFVGFVNNLLTMRSARNGIIGSRFETDGFGELLAQFVITGKVKLNRIEGYDPDDIEKAERTINHILGEMMNNLRGKILAF